MLPPSGPAMFPSGPLFLFALLLPRLHAFRRRNRQSAPSGGKRRFFCPLIRAVRICRLFSFRSPVSTGGTGAVPPPGRRAFASPSRGRSPAHDVRPRKKAGERLLSAATGAGTLRAASADVPLPPPDPAACSSTPGMPPGGLFLPERLFLPKRRTPAAQSARTIPPRAFLSPARAFPSAAPFRKTPASSIRVGKHDAAPGHATIKRPVGTNKRRQPFLPLIPRPPSVPRTGKNAPVFPPPPSPA